MKHDDKIEHNGMTLDRRSFPYGHGDERCKHCIAGEDEALCALLPTCGGKQPHYFVEHELTFEDLIQ